MEEVPIIKENGVLLNGLHNNNNNNNNNSSSNSTLNECCNFNQPQNVGILGAEFYFPKSFVDQSELEKFDNVSQNKYTLGLGQIEMAFCHENEDSCSMALSVTAQLLENYEIDPCSIGFLAVGTETLVDRSKSIKSVVMDLFLTSGNVDIEGVDEKNACFGGTQALLHSVDWIYSNYQFEGRLAIVVCVDVAVYEKGPARSTGGAGAIAFLIGPEAPLVFDRGLRSFYSSNVYDFYKPIGDVVIEEQEETLINEIEEQQLPNQVTFQLDYLNEEDSEDDEFVVTIGDIKSNLVVPFGTAATLTKQTKSGGGGGIITNGTTIDLDTNPILKDGTPIYDLDLATMEDKPWRKPGADITDYFNYGFNEVITSTGLTTFAGGRQLVNLSGGGGGGGQDKQQQKVQKIIVDLSKPPPINAEDSMISFKTEQLDLNATTLVEHIPPISDTFIHSPISKTPPPIELNNNQLIKPPPSFDPAIPPPLALVNQLPQPQQQQQVPLVSGISQVVVPTQQHSLTQTASAPLLSTANLDLPPGVDESDGPPGISSSIPPVVSSMPPPAARILDFSQPPPTSQFSYNPTPTFPIGSNIGGPPGQQQQQPPSTFLPPSSGHYQTYAPRHFQPSYRHPFGGGGFGGKWMTEKELKEKGKGIDLIREVIQGLVIEKKDVQEHVQEVEVLLLDEVDVEMMIEVVNIEVVIIKTKTEKGRRKGTEVEGIGTDLQDVHLV
ncbi:3-hydroxy-3-methylglutaryl coenzyme A synthase [Meloidogyne graminicola]|uniref:Hydroxymethylglutaryl-CoA synthase n=1 Tax=Meloidogyne graminicola TaxID=189291 RepID=A0A8S9ZQF8_9BILA|nr:3-hydroxy-3-methylglutaryl coenzyme A synthase [Meloidogyne graminicola]